MAHAVSLAAAKERCLRKLLPELERAAGLKAALDVGCGLGHFSGFLREMGFNVRAIDVRPENVAEASARYPEIRFEVNDIENPTIESLGQFDAVLCLGLLYHLENPFLAIRNLSALTREICIIETMIAPFASPLTALIEEREGEDQGRDYIAQIPSEAWLLKVLHRVGFPYVYRVSPMPDHPDFRSSFLRKKRRTMLVAAKAQLNGSGLTAAVEPGMTGRFMWYSLGLGRLLEHSGVRRAVKTAARGFRRMVPSRHSPRPNEDRPR
ncbi:MAG TPA: methyltransferase domain-containing protein [bacterium]|nr:methyltransferase domain-containing protein [bacterium]